MSMVNKMTGRSQSPSWSDGSSSDDSSNAKHRRGPGGRGGGGNNVSGIKGPRWNEERKSLVLGRFLQPFVTRQLYRLDLQAALENFITEQGWTETPMKEMVVRIKRLLTNARDINKKKAARGLPVSSTTSTSSSTSTIAAHKKAASIAAKASKPKRLVSSSTTDKKVVAPIVTSSTASNTTTVMPSLLTTSSSDPVVSSFTTNLLTGQEVRVILKKPPTSSVSVAASTTTGRLVSTSFGVDASPLASLSVAASMAHSLPPLPPMARNGLIPPPISIPPWSPQESVDSTSSSCDESVDSEDGLFGSVVRVPIRSTPAALSFVGSPFGGAAPSTPLPSSIAVATPTSGPSLAPTLSLMSSTSSSCHDDVDSVDSQSTCNYEYTLTFDTQDSTVYPLPMLPSLPTLVTPTSVNGMPPTPAPLVGLPRVFLADTHPSPTSDDDTVDAEPVVDACPSPSSTYTEASAHSPRSGGNDSGVLSSQY